jgi:PadR family transcriptional regulator PadR
MLNALELRPGIPPGTLEMLVLRTLAAGSEMHGFEIAESILKVSEEVFLVEEGSLYPALQRLLAQGLVKAEWGRTKENRRARYYRIAPAGRRRLEQEIAQYTKVARAILLVLGLETAGPEAA